MSADWPPVSLREVTTILGDGLHGTPEYDESGEYYFINGNNLENGKIVITEKTKRASKSEYEKHKKELNERTILVSINGTLGNIAFYNGEKVFLGKSACYFNVKPGIDKHYVRYVLESRLFQDYIHNLATGSTIKNVSLKLMREFSFKLPPKSIQTSISSVLKSIDDKIQLNRQINQTLEQIAQAIFKSWFVDFEPVKAKIAARERWHALQAGNEPASPVCYAGELDGQSIDVDLDTYMNLAAMQAISGKDAEQLAQMQVGQPEEYAELYATAELFPSAMRDSELGEIPEGWSVTEIQDVAEVVKGKSYKSSELASSNTALVTLKSFNRGGGYRLDGLKAYTGSFKPAQVVEAGDLIVAYTDVTQAADVIGKPAMVVDDPSYEKLVISLDVAAVRPKQEILKPFLYGLTKTDEFQFHTKSHTTGTTVLHLAKQAVPCFRFVLPGDELIDCYAANAVPIFSALNEKVQENRTLNSLRDALLPKLLSGEITLAEAT